MITRETRNLIQNICGIVIGLIVFYWLQLIHWSIAVFVIAIGIAYFAEELSK